MDSEEAGVVAAVAAAAASGIGRPRRRRHAGPLRRVVPLRHGGPLRHAGAAGVWPRGAGSWSGRPSEAQVAEAGETGGTATAIATGVAETTGGRRPRHRRTGRGEETGTETETREAGNQVYILLISDTEARNHTALLEFPF